MMHKKMNPSTERQAGRFGRPMSFPLPSNGRDAELRTRTLNYDIDSMHFTIFITDKATLEAEKYKFSTLYRGIKDVIGRTDFSDISGKRTKHSNMTITLLFTEPHCLLGENRA